jgi:hypothetical protein
MIEMTRKVTKLWTMRDGRKVRVCDMDDGHLLNAMRMLDRTGQREFEDAWDAMEGVPDDVPVYDDLETEAMRRGLKQT